MNAEERKYKILVVDDSDVTVSFLKTILEDYNFSVITSSDGLDGIKKSTDQKPDLIFLDLMMPNLDGIKTLQVKKVLKEIKDIPVIVISANTASRNVLAAIDAGAVRVISKPLTKESIMLNVNEILGTTILKEEEPKGFSVNEKNEMYEHLRTMFFSAFPEKRANFQNAIKAKDIEKVRDLAHDLKGAGGTVGYPHISAICDDIEKREVNSPKDWIFIEFRFNELTKEILKLKDQKK